MFLNNTGTESLLLYLLVCLLLVSILHEGICLKMIKEKNKFNNRFSVKQFSRNYGNVCVKTRRLPPFCVVYQTVCLTGNMLGNNNTLDGSRNECEGPWLQG